MFCFLALMFWGFTLSVGSVLLAVPRVARLPALTALVALPISLVVVDICTGLLVVLLVEAGVAVVVPSVVLPDWLTLVALPISLVVVVICTGLLVVLLVEAGLVVVLATLPISLVVVVGLAGTLATLLVVEGLSLTVWEDEGAATFFSGF